MLNSHLKRSIFIQTTPNNADALIVKRAHDVQGKVVVRGEDIDLLVLIVALTSTEKNVLFLKPGRRQPDVIYSSQKLQQELNYPKEYILVAHAFSGCDSTSGIFLKGKNALHKLLQKGEILTSCAVFVNTDISQEEVQNPGLEIFDALI